MSKSATPEVGQALGEVLYAVGAIDGTLLTPVELTDAARAYVLSLRHTAAPVAWRVGGTLYENAETARAVAIQRGMQVEELVPRVQRDESDEPLLPGENPLADSPIEENARLRRERNALPPEWVGVHHELPGGGCSCGDPFYSGVNLSEGDTRDDIIDALTYIDPSGKRVFGHLDQRVEITDDDVPYLLRLGRALAPARRRGPS